MFPLVDSQRLAAFRLGFQGRILESILAIGIEGDIRKVQDVHGCLRSLDVAAFVLADKLTAAEFANLVESLHEAGELHDIVCAIGPVEETVSERRALEKLERVALERIEFMVRRIGQKHVALAAWQEVGNALAELRYRVSNVYEAVPVPADGWKRLHDALDRLPTEDYKAVNKYIVGMKSNNLLDLALKLKEAYSDMCQYLSTPDHPHDQLEPTTPTLTADVLSPPQTVVLQGEGKPPLVLGKEKKVLTFQRYNVILALLEAGSGGLNKDDLQTKSGHSDARKILKRLSESDPDWATVIQLAGVTGGRYRLL
jgi:hypothetical protein